MADRLSLALEKRTLTGKKVGRLRREGILPATVYGKGVGPFTVQLASRAFSDIYRRTGKATLIDLQIPGEPKLAAFIHTLQRHPVSRLITHVDFRVVDLLVEITVAIPIHIIGKSLLVVRGDAILNQSITTLDVHALPTDLPSHIDIDISGLDSFEKNIHVRDITLPGKGTVVTDGDEVIISLTHARPEEPTEGEESGAAKPELVRDKREDEE